MRKFNNVLAVFFLLSWVQICFSDEIPSGYRFQFFDKFLAPNTVDTDFGSGSCPGTEDLGNCATKNEVQGITTIKGIGEEKDYWILSKNKWFYIYSIEENDSLFPTEHKLCTFEDGDKHGLCSFENKEYESGNKMKDIDFFENHLYVPRGNKIDIFEWNSVTEQFNEEISGSWHLDMEPFSVAIHPYSKDVFYQMNENRDKIIGKKMSNDGTYLYDNIEIEFIDKYDIIPDCSGQVNHNILTENFTRQGMTFSPNGRFFFFVHDDDLDEDSEKTGIYVYYLDYENYDKLFSNESNILIHATLVGFENIKYNPDVDICDNDRTCRFEELEGIDVEEIQGYDVHQLFLQNRELNHDEQFSIIHYRTGDYDGDGIKDIYDKCPFIQDDQADLDGDGIGDECDRDRDGDGVPNIHDNCPDDYNPNQENWNASEEGRLKIGDACQDSDYDGWIDIKDACPNRINIDTCGNESCRDSDSECCVNARADCDMDGDGRRDEESAFEDFYDNYGFAAGAWGEGGLDDCDPTGWHSNSYITTWYESCYVGSYLRINGGASYLKDNDQKYKQAKTSSYYCYCGTKEYEHNECKDSGKCGRNHANTEEPWNNKNSKPTWMPLYSKGIDYKDKNFDSVVSDNCKAIDKKCFTAFEREWEYREDEWLMEQIGEEENDEDTDNDIDIDIELRTTEDDDNEFNDDDLEDDVPRIKLSHAVVFTKNTDYIDDSDHSINTNFFSNSGSYQTHLKGASWNQKLILAKKSFETVDLVVERRMFFVGYITPGYGKWYWEMLREYIGEKPWWQDLPFARQFRDIIKENMYETISRSSLFSRVSYNGEEIKVQAVRYPKNYNQIFAYAIQNGIYYQKNGVFKLAFSDATGIFGNAKTVQNGFEMRSAAVAVKGIEIYMAAGMTLTQSQLTRSPFEGHPAEEKPIRNQRFSRIYFVNGEPVMEELASLPWIPEYITLFVSDGQIHAMMMNENGSTSVLAYSSENNSWVTLNTFNFGQVFSLNNTFVKDNKLYFTAPNAEGKTALYTWDSSNSFVEIAHLDSAYDSFVKPFKFADEIILADLKDISGNSVVSWELDEGGIFEEVTLPVDKPEIHRDYYYCLKESETAIQGGIKTSGECVPFTHPWYNSFSAGATVYSLDGKGERLYVGMNNAIKVYDISDPITPVLLSSFSTSSRVNDLEVYGDYLFAATNSGLYKLDASDPDELTQTLFVSAFLNYQYKVEVYNGKLYVGDDNGIKIRDLETMSILTSVNNGSVLDFAIENGEIGLYKDALFYPVEIRDAETLTLKADEFFGCFEIEVGGSDGRFYLSCDDETYHFEDDGDGGISFTELSGDIRELQDVYTYDGYSYIYDENTVWISTSNDVPALCGNGIVEGDEVCDGAPIDCTELDSNYVSGTATCNSTCDGYNTNNCSDDGW